VKLVFRILFQINPLFRILKSQKLFLRVMMRRALQPILESGGGDCVVVVGLGFCGEGREVWQAGSPDLVASGSRRRFRIGVRDDNGSGSGWVE
jgi:hypothetical protein